MTRIDLNIKIPEQKFFNEKAFKKDHPELYEKYLVLPTKESDLKITINWIKNMIENALNGNVDLKTGRYAKSSNLDVQRKYNKVMNCVEENEKGIVIIEDDDFKFLNRKYHQAESPISRDINKIIVAISDAIKKAEIEEKPKEKEMIE